MESRSNVCCHGNWLYYKLLCKKINKLKFQACAYAVADKQMNAESSCTLQLMFFMSVSLNCNLVQAQVKVKVKL